VPWAAEDCRRAGAVHVGDTVTEMSKSTWKAAHGLLPARPTLVLGQQSLADPAAHPPACTPSGATRTCPPGRLATPCGQRARANWERAAEPFLDRMEAAIEAHAPGFRDLVLARRAWTPPALEAADPNLVGGDQTGSFSVDQQLRFRPGPSWWRWGTPVKGLYVGDAGVPPGGGVHGAAATSPPAAAEGATVSSARRRRGRHLTSRA
jgi:phytoene dehydrogenase-like protein